MTIGRGLTAVVIFAVVGLGTSSPAWAEEMNGQYMAQEAGDPAAAWTFTPCGNGCANVVFADGRTAQATLDRGQWRLDQLDNVPQSNAPQTAPKIQAPRITPGTQSLWPTKCGPPTTAEPAGPYPEPIQPECHSI